VSSAAEMFDVLDAEGALTGEALPGEEVHSRELWHGSAHVWIVNATQEILLQYRAADKRLLPSCWDTSAAGHISAGSNASQTAVREVGEEIGLEITEAELEELGKFTEELRMVSGTIHREHMTIFGVKKDFLLEDLHIQQEELTELKLVAAGELETMLNDSVRRKELSGHDNKLFELAIQFARS